MSTHRRIRRTYLILSAVYYDGTAWVRSPRLIQRLEWPTDQVGYYLRREFGAAVALVDPKTYPDLDIREQH